MTIRPFSYRLLGDLTSVVGLTFVDPSLVWGNAAQAAAPRAAICGNLSSHLQKMVSADSGGGHRIGNRIQQCEVTRWTDGRTARPIFKCSLRTTTEPPDTSLSSADD